MLFDFLSSSREQAPKRLILDFRYGAKQAAILDDFSLFITGVRRNDALVAKGNELNKVVEPFAHGGGVVDAPSEFGFAQVLEQISAANDFPKFLKGVEEFVLPGPTGQPSENKGW